MKFIGKTGELFEVVELNNKYQDYKLDESQLSFILFEDNRSLLEIDGQEYNFESNQILCSTWLHNINFRTLGQARFLRFNTPFYCILDHDSEVGCKGVLFFGASHIPILRPEGDDLEAINAVWKMMVIEMRTVDNLQLEMLQMMLKRLIILCTRIFKRDKNFDKLDHSQIEIIREFNYLVEQNYKEKHTVAEYARLLNKSPKTLSNVFKKLNHKPPLQAIQERRMLEARRLLKYTDTPISEVGYSIGFADLQSFSRFFKKQENKSPSIYRAN